MPGADQPTVRNRSVAIIALLLLTSACSIATSLSTQVPRSSLDADEYSVYSLVLDSMYSLAMTSRHMVMDTTHAPWIIVGDDMVERALLEMAVPPDLIAAYLSANSHGAALSPDAFSTRLPVVLYSPGAQEFVTFSRVGFNADCTQAVVHEIFSCGSGCTLGQVVWLVKIGGEWIIRTTEPTIIG